jgi:hypothetical protein
MRTKRRSWRLKAFDGSTEFACLARQAQIPLEPAQQRTMSRLCLVIGIASSKLAPHATMPDTTLYAAPTKKHHGPRGNWLPIVTVGVIHSTYNPIPDAVLTGLERGHAILAQHQLAMCLHDRVPVLGASRSWRIAAEMAIEVTLFCSREVGDPVGVGRVSRQSRSAAWIEGAVVVLLGRTGFRCGMLDHILERLLLHELFIVDNGWNLRYIKGRRRRGRQSDLSAPLLWTGSRNDAIGRSR